VKSKPLVDAFRLTVQSEPDERSASSWYGYQVQRLVPCSCGKEFQVRWAEAMQPMVNSNSV